MTDDGSSRQQGVCRQVRRASVTAAARNRDFKFVRRGHHGAGLYPDLPDRHRRPNMGAEDGIHSVKAAVLDHRLCPARCNLFSKLVNEDDVSFQIFLMPHQHFCGDQKGRGMRVMAAGVHDAGDG